MNPIEQLLMASRGHQGLPMQATMGGPQGAPPGGPMMGGPGGPPPGLPPQIGGPPGLPAGLPSPTQGDSGDRQVAASAAQHLLEATSRASDPELKAALTQAAAVLHKYIVGHDKEHHQALAGKFSPRLMAAAHQGA